MRVVSLLLCSCLHLCNSSNLKSELLIMTYHEINWNAAINLSEQGLAIPSSVVE